MKPDYTVLAFVVLVLGCASLPDLWSGQSIAVKIMILIGIIAVVLLLLVFVWSIRSIKSREYKKKRDFKKELPKSITVASSSSVYCGIADEISSQVFLPDSVRGRHVHILGATGSGKTVSVILNFIKQDVERGLGAIILDAKGDASFLEHLGVCVTAHRLKVFDLSDASSLIYDPLQSGSALEAAQRLFSALNWSEEYYKSKALSQLQVIFELYRKRIGTNPTLNDLNQIFRTAESFAGFFQDNDRATKQKLQEYGELSGLKDQIQSLTVGHLGNILSRTSDLSKVFDLSEAVSGNVIYFRLQSLLSPQAVSSIGKLVINDLNFLAGTAHRAGHKIGQAGRNLIPVYFDEFASFACPEFGDLISKSRSAGMMLHFSHQSVGDLTEVSPAFLNRITDNSATKIILRINDPDSAEFFARAFGTRMIQKVTQKISNADDSDFSEVLGDGTQRDAHQFRASPDLLKTLPTGKAAILIAHGQDTPHGASSVLTVQFPNNFN